MELTGDDVSEFASVTDAVSSACAHFGECGGCVAQDVAYESQLANKSAALSELFTAWWSQPIDVIPSPTQWYYRNKVDMSFASKFYPEPPPKDFQRETVLGFKRRECWYWPLELEECRIFSRALPPLLESVRLWVSEDQLRPYNPRRDEGLLRILLVREGKRTGERMAVLITRHDDFDRSRFLEAVVGSCETTSVQWGLFSGKAEIAAADSLEVLSGAETIHEELHVGEGEAARRLKFVLSPLSFFQTNTLGTERLYGLIRSWVKECAASKLYDLYGGSGGIALTCADLVESVESVESFGGASRDGELNARLNGIDNVRFHTHAVEDYLQPVEFDKNSSVIVDPPRAGMHPKALRRLVELRPSRLLYVSCKPTVLAKELHTLDSAFELENLQAVDLFPHTPHVEVVATLRART